MELKAEVKAGFAGGCNCGNAPGQKGRRKHTTPVPPKGDNS